MDESVEPETSRGPTKRPRAGIGPFSLRQVGLLVGVVVAAFVILTVGTTPIGSSSASPVTVPRASAYLIGDAPTNGLRPGQVPPEFEVDLEDGSTYQLADLEGAPVRLDALRGKAVWINFWASWCPPCQQETPIIRELDDRYRDRGLEIIGISIQETSPTDVAAYADRYDLRYRIAFDGSGHVMRAYRVFAIPTQFFITPEGVVAHVINGPVELEEVSAIIESLLP